MLKAILIHALALTMVSTSLFGDIPKTRISLPGHWAVLGSWDTPPDSPDGSKLVYLRLLEPPDGYDSSKPAELWVCNTDGSGHYKLADDLSAGPHDGAAQRFLTDDRIIYASREGMKIVDLQGNLIAICQGLSKHDNVANRFYTRSGKGAPIRAFDYDGNFKGDVIHPRAFEPYKDQMAGSDDPDEWVFRHIHISPNGEYIMAQIDTGKQPWYLVTFRNDGSDSVYFGIKPLHCTWWDDTRIVGGYGDIFDRHNNKIGIACGRGNHAAFSPDRSWVVNDVDYHTAPIRLTLYQTGQTTGTLIDEHSHTQLVWDRKAHLNPAFSHDGSRVYWNRAVAENTMEVWWFSVKPAAR